MEIRILGRDLEVSEIGFGCMGMSHAYVNAPVINELPLTLECELVKVIGDKILLKSDDDI